MQPICKCALFLVFVLTIQTFSELHAANENIPKFNTTKENTHTTPFTVSLHQQLTKGLDSLQVFCTITANKAFSASNTLKIQIALEEDRFLLLPSNNLNRVHARIRTRLTTKNLPVQWADQEKYALDFSMPIPRNLVNKGRLFMRASLWSSDQDTLLLSTTKMIEVPYDLIAEGIQGLELMNCGNDVEPVLIFKNAGVIPLTSCTLSYKFDQNKSQTIHWTGELKPGHSTIVNLPATTLSKGKHRFQFSLSDPNGEKEFVLDNNSYKIAGFYMVESIAAPFNLNFQSSSRNDRNTPFILHNTNPNELKWSFKNSISSFGKASKSLSLNLLHTSPGVQNELILPIKNLDQLNRPQLRFNYAYFQQNHGNEDQLEVMISTDCGTTWRSIWSKQGSNLATAFPAAQFKTPGRKDWKNIRFDLFEVAKQSEMLLKFVLTSDAGNAFFLDDINISSDTSAIQTELVLAPNPCNGIAQFTINNAFNEEYTLKVLNTAGQIVFVELIDVSSNTFTDTINLLHLPSGVYPVALYNKSGLIGKPKQLVVLKP